MAKTKKGKEKLSQLPKILSHSSTKSSTSKAGKKAKTLELSDSNIFPQTPTIRIPPRPRHLKEAGKPVEDNVEVTSAKPLAATPLLPPSDNLNNALHTAGNLLSLAGGSNNLKAPSVEQGDIFSQGVHVDVTDIEISSDSYTEDSEAPGNSASRALELESSSEPSSGEDEDDPDSEDEEVPSEESDDGRLDMTLLKAIGMKNKAASKAKKTKKKKKGRGRPKKPEPVEELEELLFSVPAEGAREEITIYRFESFDGLVKQLADTMNVGPKNVKVAYKFSVVPGKDYAHLNKSEHLEALWVKADSLKSSTRSKKPFIVELKNLQPDKMKDDGKNKKKRKKGDSSDSELDLDEDGKVDPKKLKQGAMSEAQWVSKLQEELACRQHHGSHCYKPLGQDHIQLTKADLSGWAIYLNRGYTSLTEPPPRLSLDRDAFNGKTKKRGVQGSTKNFNEGFPQGHFPWSPMPGMNPGFYAMPYGSPYSFPPMQVTQTATHSVDPPQWTPGTAAFPNHAQSQPDVVKTPTRPSVDVHSTAPTSSPMAPNDNFTRYPTTDDFLRQLDATPFAAEGHKFGVHAENLVEAMYRRVSDLEDLDIPGLQRLCPDIPERTAQILLKAAGKEARKIRREVIM